MLKLYGVPISVHTRKVVVTAIEKKIAYENEPVIPFQPPPGWDDLSPTGKIPVCRDGELVLRDSSVICAYLERTHPAPPLYPSGNRDYAQALWFEEYADGTVFRDVMHGLFFQKIVRPNILKQPADAGVIDAILNSALPRVFGYLDAALGRQYLAGVAFSVADIALISNLINFHYLGFSVDRRRFPNLVSYFDEQLKRPSIVAALAAERPVAANMGLDGTFIAKRLAA